MKILLGDFNLKAEQTDQICQGVAGVPGYDTQWHPQAAKAGRGGDVMLISGSDSTVFDIAIGRSYDDRGMRNDNHDAFGVAVQVPLLFGDVTQLAEKASASNSAKASAEKPRPSCNRTRLAEEALASRSATADAAEPVCKKAKAAEPIANAEKPITNAEETNSEYFEESEDSEDERRKLRVESEKGLQQAEMTLQQIYGDAADKWPTSKLQELDKQFEKEMRGVEEALRRSRIQSGAAGHASIEELDPGFTPDFEGDGPREESTAEKIYREMVQWYIDHADSPELVEGWRSLGNFLFKQVKHRQQNDLWLDEPLSSGDVSQLSDAKPKLVVSAEFVALKVKQVIEL